MAFLVPLFIFSGLVFFLWKPTLALLRKTLDFIVLCAVAQGGSGKRNSMPKKFRLHLYVCQTDYLDESSVAEIFRFLTSLLETSVDIRAFHKILLTYSHTILYRDRRDGSLRGIVGVGMERNRESGNEYSVLRLGLTYIEKEYRDGPYLYYIMTYLRVMEFLRHPFTPFYAISKVFGYRGYGKLSHNVRCIYPSYREETPDHIKKIMLDYAMKVKFPNEVYDPKSSILKRKIVTMKSHVSEPRAVDSKDPHVKFFVKTNPGWNLGHQMVTLAVVDFRDILGLVYNSVSRTMKAMLSQTSRQNGSRKKPRLLKRLTFQSELGNQSLVEVLKRSDNLDFPESNGEEDYLEDLSEII